MNALQAHLATTGLSDAEFGALVKLDRSVIHKMRNGKVRPSLDKAIEIARVTEGAVPVESWAKEAPVDTEAA